MDRSMLALMGRKFLYLTIKVRIMRRRRRRMKNLVKLGRL